MSDEDLTARDRGDRLRARMRRARTAIALLTALLVPNAAWARPRLALLPVDTVGVPADRGERLWTALAQALRDAGAAEPVPRAEIEAALGDGPAARAACLHDPACIERVASGVGAPMAMVVTLSGLGDTHLVRLRLHDAGRGGAAREVRETVIGTEQAMIVEARVLAVRMLREPSAPWYGRWWAWAAIGVGVVAAVAVPLALRDAGGGPDVANLGPLP